MKWTHYAILFVGLWLIASPGAFGYYSDEVARNNDLICGILAIAFGIYSLTRLKVWAAWMTCLIGVWLQIAPLVFWAKEPANYLSDTLSGVLLIAFAILIPRLPHEHEDDAPKTPSGWSFNPSAWEQRFPVIAMACICWFLARYLASFQLGYNITVWDPIFHDGTRQVLTSKVSHSFPVADAGLGAFSYTLETLLGCVGGVKRWRTMPWIVIFFGILVVPVSVVSIVLVILQPVAVGAWCSICLLIALIMLIMATIAVSEVVATVQFLHWSTKKGHGFWRTFLKGGAIPEGRASKQKDDDYNVLIGVSPNTNLVISVLIGFGLMLSPAIFAMHQVVADNIHIIGALTITFSTLAMSEVLRLCRFINAILGAYLILAVLYLDVTTVAGEWWLLLAGLFLVILCFRRGTIEEKYGSYQSIIR